MSNTHTLCAFCREGVAHWCEDEEREHARGEHEGLTSRRCRDCVAKRHAPTLDTYTLSQNGAS